MFRLIGLLRLPGSGLCAGTGASARSLLATNPAPIAIDTANAILCIVAILVRLVTCHRSLVQAKA